MFMTMLRIAGLVVLGCGLATAVSARAPIAAEGRTLATQACSACHQVTETQPPSSAVLNPDSLEHVRAPSFVQISQRYGKNTKRLRAYILLPKHPMPEQKFLPHDLDAIVVYIRSLDRRR